MSSLSTPRQLRHGQLYVYSGGFIHRRALGGSSSTPPVPTSPTLSSTSSTTLSSSVHLSSPSVSSEDQPSASPNLQPHSQIESQATPFVVNRNITWISPLSNQTYTPGQTLVVKWDTLLALISPSFRLCLGGPGGLDPSAVSDDDQKPEGDGNDNSSSGSADVTASNGTDVQGAGLVSGLIPAGTPMDSVKHGVVPIERCGSLVNPSIQQEADGLYFVSLALPNVTSTQQFFLRLQDMLGFEFDSAPFFLGQLSTSDSADRESSDPVPVVAVSDVVPSPAATHVAALFNATSSGAGILPSQPGVLAPRALLEGLSARDLGVTNSLLPFDRVSGATMAIAIAVPLIVVFLVSSTAVYLYLRRRWKLDSSHRPLVLTEKVSLRGQRESWVGVGGNPYLNTRSRETKGEKKKQRKEIPKMLASLDDLEDLVRSMSDEMGIGEEAKGVKKPEETHTMPGRMSSSGSPSRSRSNEGSGSTRPAALPELLFSAGSSAWSSSAGSKSRSATAESAVGPPPGPSHPLLPPPLQEANSRSLTDSYFKALVNSGLDEEPPTTSTIPTSVGSRPRPSPIPEEYQSQRQLFSSPVQQEELQAALASSPLLRNGHEMKREEGSGYFGKRAEPSLLRDPQDEREVREKTLGVLRETMGSASQRDADELDHSGDGQEEGREGSNEEEDQDEEETELAEVKLSPLPPSPPSPAAPEPTQDRQGREGLAGSQTEAETVDVDVDLPNLAAGTRKGRVADIARALEAKAVGSGVEEILRRET